MGDGKGLYCSVTEPSNTGIHPTAAKGRRWVMPDPLDRREHIRRAQTREKEHRESDRSGSPSVGRSCALQKPIAI